MAEEGIIDLKMRVENSRAKQNWEECKTLIIDEVSMVYVLPQLLTQQISDEFFDKLDAIARYIRQSSEAFGGIQLVLCGDFYQLPPIAVDSL